jgi:hypothetical protein
MIQAQEFHDPADSIHASYWPDPAERIDTPADAIRETAGSRDIGAIASHIRSQVRCQVADKIASAIGHVLALLDMDQKPDLALQCCLYAINRHPLTETQIAVRFGVTRAAVSKRIIRYCEFLGLPEARGMKRAKARDSYELRQRRVAKVRHRAKSERQTTIINLFGGTLNEQRN